MIRKETLTRKAQFANFGAKPMKTRYLTTFVSIALLLALAGASCRSEGNVDGNGPTTLYGSEEKDGYAENVQIKIDDLAVHIGKIKESRALVSADAQASFDAAVADLETKFTVFKDSFEGFKSSAVESFMTEREKLNNALVGVEDLYLKVITDFKLDI
jgi:hypothetical protein